MAHERIKSVIPDSVWKQKPKMYYLTPYDWGILVTSKGEQVNCHACTLLIMIRTKSDFIYVRLYSDKSISTSFCKGSPSFMTDGQNDTDLEGHRHKVYKKAFSFKD